MATIKVTRWVARVLVAVFPLAALVSGALAAVGTWALIMPPESRPVVVPPPTTRQSEPAVSVQEQAEAIAAAAWFGTPAPVVEPPPRPEPQPEPEPVVRETRLNLVLRGVLAASEPKRGSAMIARQSGGSAELFRVNDTVFGNAELAEVHADRVVLRRGDALETLRFPGGEETDADSEAGPSTDRRGSGGAGQAGRSDVSSAPRTSSQPSRRNTNGSSGITAGQSTPEPARSSRDSAQARLEEEISQAISAVQARASSDPQGLLRQYGLEATGDSYRVTSRASVLIANGLRPGDRVTEINNQPVGNVDRDRARIDSVLSGDEIQITLERGGATYRIYQALPD